MKAILDFVGIPAICLIAFVVFCLFKGGNNGGNSNSSGSSNSSNNNNTTTPQ